MRPFRRRRPDRVHPARHRLESGLEQLESRQLLSNALPKILTPTLLIPNNGVGTTAAVFANHPTGTNQRALSFLDNDGKILTGKDRQGNEWQITVHGPGAVIVTDATPNDGALDDDINTIQLIGTDPNLTYVTGNVVASPRLETDGTVVFNHLISENGVASIVLNGFNLARTVTPPIDQTQTIPEIDLPGGVRYLQFNNIIAPVSTGTNGTPAELPFTIMIGDAAHPLAFKPTIRIASIFNTITDYAQAQPNPVLAPAGVPATAPTVNILVNGQLHGLEMVSATQSPLDSAGFQYAYFPQTTTTGRTAIQALGIDSVKAVGSLRNTTFSRGAMSLDPATGLPASTVAQQNDAAFSSGLTGLDHLGSITVGGVTDGLGLDVSQGNIGRIRLLRGLGDPTGYQTGLPGGSLLGAPVSAYGYPAFGLYGGLIATHQIGSLTAGAANTTFQPVQDPDFAQVRVGSTRYFTRPGAAMTNAGVLTDGSIGKVDIVGNLFGTEIKAGANYNSFVQGLEPVRQASSIGPLRIRGNLIDSVVSATWRPGASGFYGQFNPATQTTDNQAGPGVIRGNLQQGALYTGGQRTILNNAGSGFFAKIKHGYLPPPEAPKRVDSVNLGL